MTYLVINNVTGSTTIFDTKTEVKDYIQEYIYDFQADDIEVYKAEKVEVTVEVNIDD